MKHSKRYLEASKKVDNTVEYSLEEAVQKLKETANAKFNESVEMHVSLGVDPRKADQMVRGTVMLPHGTGKTVRVVVLAKGVKETEAKEAGADHVGNDELIEKIKGGWLDFEVIIATPDMMGQVGKLGKLLGPRGLMPNPKSGTVTFEVAEAVKQVKAGKIEFKVDRYGIVHAAIGKVSFNEEQIKENVKSFIDTIVRMRPPSAKGQYVKNITIASTMGPGIHLNRMVLLSDLR